MLRPSLTVRAGDRRAGLPGISAENAYDQDSCSRTSPGELAIYWPCCMALWGSGAPSQPSHGRPIRCARISCRLLRDRLSPPRASLKTYQYPEWFRDAKLGMWAHWGPQAVPMFGDWYARQLYQQGHAQYKDHLEHYGHPTKLGLQGLDPALEGREMGSRPVDGTLQEGRSPLLRQHGGAPRQLRPLELDAP